jgi:hypothetical protein
MMLDIVRFRQLYFAMVWLKKIVNCLLWVVFLIALVGCLRLLPEIEAPEI